MSTFAKTEPSEECPQWCEYTFCTEAELPRDRMHRSEIIEVAGIARTRHLDSNTGQVVRSAEPVMMNLLASSYLEERRTWVVIATDECALEISIETAIELYAALGEVLSLLERP